MGEAGICQETHPKKYKNHLKAQKKPANRYHLMVNRNHLTVNRYPTKVVLNLN
jgi:hypothetical protein